MSCSDCGSDDALPVVERRVELPAAPEAVWDALPSLLGDEVELAAEPGGVLRADGPDGRRVGVVEEAVPGERLVFRWAVTGTDDAPSQVEIDLERGGTGTILHLREIRLDGDHLVRTAFLALARA